MNGIKMKDCRFYVNEEKHTVICVIPNTKDMLVEFIAEHFRWDSIDIWNTISGKLYTHDLRLPHSFTGKAVCAPEDNWDVETGKLIAFSRAKDKCYKSFFKRANKLVQAIDARLGDMITMFNDFGVKLEDKRDALQEEIDARLKGE